MWAAYIQRRGTLNAGLRTEVMMGQLLAMVSQALGGKAEPLDFMPHIDKPVPPPPEELTLDALVAAFGAVAK